MSFQSSNFSSHGLTVVGNGMLAQAFKKGLVRNRSLVVFASGVSDSGCVVLENFNRERELLTTKLHQIQGSRPFIYFGTCSVYDPDSWDRPYVIHKKAMESLVLSHPCGLVVRLPQVVGSQAPSSTLLASLVTRIRQGRKVQVWQNAVRNLLDVEDVVCIVDAWLTLSMPKDKVLNVANPNSVSILELIHIIETELNLMARIVRVSKGAEYKIDIQPMLAAASLAQVDFGKDYLRRLVRKYYG